MTDMIDLHSHTDQSDGTFTAAELVNEAVRVGLSALSITDHDTFAGYDLAEPLAKAAGIDLVCGIELSTKYGGASVHLLGYFPWKPPSAEFRAWLGFLLESRRDRNRRLIDKLRSLGVDDHAGRGRDDGPIADRASALRAGSWSTRVTPKTFRTRSTSTWTNRRGVMCSAMRFRSRKPSSAW